MMKLVRSDRWSVFLVSFVLAAMFGMPQAFADKKEKEDFEDTIHVIQKKPVLLKNRLEIQPRFGLSVNDSVYRSFKAGANLNFHFSERAYIGGVFEWFDFGDVLGGTTQTFDKSFDQTRTAPDAPVPNYFAALEGGFKPIYGKFALFNLSIIYYDVGVTLGVGYVNADSLTLQSAGGPFAATGSVIGRFFLSDWLAFNMELRDMLYPGKLSGEGGTVNKLANIVTVAGGISLFFPTSFEYSSEEPKK